MAAPRKFGRPPSVSIWSIIMGMYVPPYDSAVKKKSLVSSKLSLNTNTSVCPSLFASKTTAPLLFFL